MQGGEHRDERPSPLDSVRLNPLTATDLDELFAIQSDPRVWRHLPSGRHAVPEQTSRVIEVAERSRDRTGLGHWAVRDRASGRMLGSGGVHLREPAVWNLGFRFHRDAQGHGLATAVARHAVERARATRPEVPIAGRVLGINSPSIRVLEKAGLPLVWSGGVLNRNGRRLDRRIHSDRALSRAMLDGLIALG